MADRRARYGLVLETGQRAGKTALAGLTPDPDVIPLPPADDLLAEVHRKNVAYRARKLGIEVEFVGFADLHGCIHRIRSGSRIESIDSRVSPRAYEAALIALAHATQAA